MPASLSLSFSLSFSFLLYVCDSLDLKSQTQKSAAALATLSLTPSFRYPSGCINQVTAYIMAPGFPAPAEGWGSPPSDRRLCLKAA